MCRWISAGRLADCKSAAVRTDVHKDGWGIAFFEGKGVRLLHEPNTACASPLADFVTKNPIQSKHVVAHIRRATVGRVSLENTHPFMRELWGHYWIFAHNGHLDNFHPDQNGRFTPVGDTDSEAAFCWMLQELNTRFGPHIPLPTKIFDAVRELSIELTRECSFNFLLSNGSYLLAHASTRLSWVGRESLQGRAAIIATEPLSNEPWRTLAPGTLCLFQDGQLKLEATTLAGKAKPETEGFARTG